MKNQKNEDDHDLDLVLRPRKFFFLL